MEERQGLRVPDRRETRSRRGSGLACGRTGQAQSICVSITRNRSQEERSRNLGSQRLNLHILCLPRWKIASTAAFVGVWDCFLG